ncbi:MAG: amino acid permease [Bryobacteraceae bacterium]|jgi:APA family basic amino acid/polyamine antiporter
MAEDKVALPGLKRELGVWSAASIVVGTVIGSGIFLVPKKMIASVGSPEVVFAVWIVGGLLSLFGALTYAELATAMPEAGGEYVYLREAYGPLWGFLYGWTQLLVAKSGSIATLATGFYLYMANFRPELTQAFYTLRLPIGPEGGPLKMCYGQLLAIALILVLAVVNYLGVRFGGAVQVAVTVVKVGLIAAIIAIGLGGGHGTVANYASSIPVAGGAAGFFAALVGALWAYDGWNNVSMVSSEIRDPQRSLPRALIAGTAVVIGIYLLTNLAYFYVLSAREVASSDRVAADMMGRIFGERGAAAVSIAALVSIFAALNGSILSGARVPYAMARDGLFFRSVGGVHPVYRTPGVSILALNAWAALLVLSGRFEELYTYVIFASWILYGMTAAAVLVLRRKRPELARPYRTLGYPWVPVLFVLGALGVVLFTLRRSPRESLLGLGLILAGLPFYFHWKRRFSG